MENERGNPKFFAETRNCSGQEATSIASGVRLRADLTCAFDGYAFSIKTSDNVIVVGVSGLNTGVRLFRKVVHQNHLTFDRNQLVDCIRLLHNTLEFRVGGVCISTIGGGNDSSFGRFISYKGIRLMPIAALRAAFKRR